MGTNYYVRNKKCETCEHTPVDIHLGKSSMGWVFTFQLNGGTYYKNVKEMREWTKGKHIVDEYERTVSYEDFWRMVEEKQKDPKNLNHAAEMRKQGRLGSDFIIDGYSFTDCDFS